MTESDVLNQIFSTHGYTNEIKEKLQLGDSGTRYATILKHQWKNNRLPNSAKERLLKAFGYKQVSEPTYEQSK